MKKALALIFSFLLSALSSHAADKIAPRRIVSLMPSNTEILYDLGVGSSVIGVTNYCDYPEDAKTKEKVGDYIHPNLEKIVSLKPDLVLAGLWKSTHIVPRLRKSGTQVIEIDLPASLDDIYKSIDDIASAVNREKEGKELVEGLKLRVEKISADVQKRKERPSIYIEVDPPNWTITRMSFIDEAIELCGCRNIFKDLPASGVQISWEAVVQKNPDVILVFQSKKSELARRPGWHKISAVKNNRIIDDLGNNTLNRPTPRVVLGMEQLSERLKELGFK